MAAPVSSISLGRGASRVGGSRSIGGVGSSVGVRIGVSKVRFGSWNVGTLTGKSSELVKVLSGRGVDFACVQETRWVGSKAREIGGWKLWYSGGAKSKNGVGILVAEKWREHVVGVERFGDRLMSLKVVVGGAALSIICAYAPQVGLGAEEKRSFWEALDGVVRAIPGEERFVIGGDFNGHIGKSREGFADVHGGFGFGSRNDSGRALLEFSVAFGCVIANSWFKKRDEHLITYQSPPGSTQIDYFLVRGVDRSSCRDCKVIPFGGISSLHHLLVLDLEFKGRASRRVTRSQPKIRWRQLSGSNGPLLRDRIIEEAERKGLWLVKDSAEEMWVGMAESIRMVASDVLGMSRGGKGVRRGEVWWNVEVQGLVKAKQEAFKRVLGCASVEDREGRRVEYKAAKRAAKQAVARAKDAVFAGMYRALDEKGGERLLYNLARVREGKSRDLDRVRCIKDEGGRVLVDELHIKARWQGYFSGLLNGGLESVRGASGRSPNDLSSCRRISSEEVKEVVRKMKNGRACGPDGIPLEVWRCLGDKGMEWLTSLFNVILRTAVMPGDWRLSTLIPVYKNKGDIQDCGNYRGIKLLSHTMKVWEKVIEMRLRSVVEVSENQFGFMPGRSSMEAIHLLRRLVEAHRDMKKNLHMVFVDLEKAYDSVPRELLWRSLDDKEVSGTYCRVIRDMYEGARTCVSTPGGETDYFPVQVGLHQGSALSPFLFALVMDVVSGPIQGEVPWCMLFADDIVLVDVSCEGVSTKLESWRAALESKGFRLSRTKTEYVEFVLGGSGGSHVRVPLGEDDIPRKECFKYLGSVFQSDGGIDRDVEHRIQAGWQKWRGASGVLCDKKVPLKLKGKFYKTVVRPALLYGAECWPTTKAQEQKLKVAEMRMLRWMCGHTRLDKIRNEVIRDKVGVASIGDKLRESRLRWFGHVLRRDPRAPVRRTEGLDLGDVRRGRGRPKKSWKEVIRQDLALLSISEDMAMDRAHWRASIRVAEG